MVFFSIFTINWRHWHCVRTSSAHFLTCNYVTVGSTGTLSKRSKVLMHLLMQPGTHITSLKKHKGNSARDTINSVGDADMPTLSSRKLQRLVFPDACTETHTLTHPCHVNINGVFFSCTFILTELSVAKQNSHISQNPPLICTRFSETASGM